MTNDPFQSLLRSFVQEEPPEEAAGWDPAALWQTAARQKLLPVLAYEDRRWQLFDDPACSSRLQKLLRFTMAGNIGRIRGFEDLSADLTAHGIAHMPVKGYYLRNYYPAPELRTFGDIDILIHPEDRAAVHDRMLALGFTVKQDWEPTFSYRQEGKFYEIHTNLMDANLDGRADLQAYFAAAWQHAEPDSGLRYRPALDFHLIYAICHLAKHLYGGGAGARMYLDIALLLRREDAALPWDSIRDALAALGLTEFFQTVLNACRVWFGTETVCPLPEPDTEALAALWAYTLDSDVFGHDRDRTVVHLRNTDTAQRRGALVRKMLFPPAEQIQARYTFLQGRPWLLPAAWLIRPFANLDKIPERLQDLRRIREPATRTVDDYNSFMERIGL